MRDAIFRVGDVFGGCGCGRASTRVVGLEICVIECHGVIFIVFLDVQLSAVQVATVADGRGRRRTRSDPVW
jgi:hypothetical protein